MLMSFVPVALRLQNTELVNVSCMCKISVGDAARNDLICSVTSHRFTVGSQVLWKALSQCAALCCAVCPRSLKRPLYQRPSCVLVCGVVSRSAAVTREVR